MKITATGYEVGAYEEILTEITEDIKAGIPDFNETDANVIVDMNKIMANLTNKLSLMGLDLYNSRAVDTASGETLNKILSNFAIIRNGAIPSTGSVTFSGTDGTAIPSGFRVGASDNRVYRTVTSGITASGTLTLEVASVTTGIDTTADTGVVTSIVNPLNGVDSVINSSPITGGRDVESDVELRKRYYLVVEGMGKSTYAAVKAAILNNTLATKVNIIENATSVVDALGIPAHSFRPVVLGGDQENILEQIFASRPIGIVPDGNITKEFEGKYQSAFSRPNTQSAGFSVTITKNPDTVMPNASDIITSDIISAISSLPIGSVLSHSTFLSAMYKSTGNFIVGFSDFQFWVDPLDKKGLGEEITQTEMDDISIVETNITITVV